MKKIFTATLVLWAIVCLASCKGATESHADVEENRPEITYIELQYGIMGANKVTIDDREMITQLKSYMEQAAGERDTSIKCLYGMPYSLTVHYNDGSSFIFNLYGSTYYTTSKDTYETEYFTLSYYYADDMQQMYAYLSSHFPTQ